MRYLLLILLLLPALLSGEMLTYSVDNEGLVFDPDSGQYTIAQNTDWAYTTAPGSYRLPVRTVNIILPPDAENVVQSNSVSARQTRTAPAPELNTPYSDGSRLLTSKPTLQPGAHVIYQGVGKWGEVSYARFSILPALYNDAAQSYELAWEVTLSVSFTQTKELSNRTFRAPELLRKDPSFVNSEVLERWYPQSTTRLYDYLVVTTPALNNAATALAAFRQGQGLVTSFADIDQVLNTSLGSTPADKLRNYLISEYATSPFSYLLLIGDIDVVPIAYLTPEPDGGDTVPSDFFYSDLSSDFDLDDDGLLGEYDTGMDYTPELFVGRIPWNDAAIVSQICSRIVNFESSSAPWKNKALLPAAMLNYADEGTGYERTDGATFMEYCKATALRYFDNTTMYEQAGLLPSQISDYVLNADNFSNLINTQSWGIVNWSAHGSSTSSARKVWMVDFNTNNLPDADEMEWYELVNTDTFNGLTNQDGSVYFCASCNNGMLDDENPSLGEWLIRKKSVADIAATRTGWYKLGWANPGWGGLSSYNYHFLENYASAGMTVGQAHGFANWLHTQYCLFGDPVDADGIIWPELQNVYTYLLFGDPAVGYPSQNNASAGSILVWEPYGTLGNTLIAGLLDLAAFNVVYTDHLIDTYNYLNQFDAVFCLFGLGYGLNNYYLTPDSLGYGYLLDYLQQGGKVYMEGMLSWDQADSLYGRFGTIAPFNHVAFIEHLRYNNNGNDQIWDYNGYNGGTQALAVYGDTAQPLFYSYNTEHVNDIIGIWNRVGESRTISSSFNITGVYSNLYTYPEFLAIVLDTLDVFPLTPVPVNDETLTPEVMQVSAYPNPFSGNISISAKSNLPITVSIYNLRGQLLTSSRLLPLNGKITWQWDGRTSKGNPSASGIYLLKTDNGRHSQVSKILKLR